MNYITTIDQSILDELEEMTKIDNKFEEIKTRIKSVIKKDCWEDFRFHSGKILGVLRTIAQNPKDRQELLMITGLTQAHIDFYTKYCGNLPFVTKDGVLNLGRQMDTEKTRKFLPIVGNILGLPLTEEDLSDITDERWTMLYNTQLETVKKTMEIQANCTSKDEDDDD